MTNKVLPARAQRSALIERLMWDITHDDPGRVDLRSCSSRNRRTRERFARVAGKNGFLKVSPGCNRPEIILLIDCCFCIILYDMI